MKTDIRTMKLYHHVERVYNELRELGKSTEDALRVEELVAFDQMHYHGTAAVDEAVRLTGIGPATSVLEIGSGLGGPARHMAHSAGAVVTALELQDNQHRLAAKLTERCGLSDRVDHVCGDFLSYDAEGRSFDVIVSWLALYHIPDRPQLLRKCLELLHPGGGFFAEDLYCRQLFSSEDWVEVSTELYVRYLPDFEGYRLDLENAGFVSIDCKDMSDDWGEFTRGRMTRYREQRARHLRVHGESIYASLDAFYDIVVGYFSSGQLGGIRVVASKV